MKFLALLCFLLLDLTVPASAQFNSSALNWTSGVATGGGGGGAGCTTPTAPTEVATALGANPQLAINIDFSLPQYATRTSPGCTNQANGWLGCYNADTNIHELWQGANTDLPSLPPPACSSVVPGYVNPTDGATVLRLIWSPGSCPSTCLNIVQSGVTGAASARKFFDIPGQNSFIEIKMALSVNILPGHYNQSSGDTSGLATYNHWPTSGGFDPIEWDPVLYGVVGSNHTPPDGSDNYCDAFQWGPIGGGANFLGCAFLNTPGFAPTTPHIFGSSITSTGVNGSTVRICTWMDHALRSGGCGNTTIQGTQSTGRRFFLVQAGSTDTGSNWDTYVYYIRVWTRNGCSWQTDQCNGAVAP